MILLVTLSSKSYFPSPIPKRYRLRYTKLRIIQKRVTDALECCLLNIPLVILHAILYGCKTLSLTSWDESILRVFEKRTVIGYERKEVNWRLEKSE
jgi:hypothetical protein